MQRGERGFGFVEAELRPVELLAECAERLVGLGDLDLEGDGLGPLVVDRGGTPRHRDRADQRSDRERDETDVAKVTKHDQ
ncbi:MAG: hypothetical protein EXQ79_00050 [Acidimicrobiia bacterium]|nr:hypothetical protein [Acidimicrobiia bacterium]